MPAYQPLVFDAWTNLSFKRSLGSRRQPGTSWLAPDWVGDHGRRLQAYKILQSYIDNAARHFLSSTDEEVIDQHREYGDSALIRDQILAALLGDDQTVVVPGADDFDPEAEDNDPEAGLALELQDWVRDWAVDERLGLKVLENERSAIGLGDGLYTLGFSADKNRVRLRIWDPGFYFPVLDDGNEDDFPRTVHVAWELPEQPNDKVRRIRRITWKLVDPPEGRLYTHPWNEEGTTTTCLMTDATWTLDKDRQSVYDLSEGSAAYSEYVDSDGVAQDWKDIDLEIDFIPAVHLPNTVSLLNHYGRSSLATVLQILDDLANADTDLQASSATTGKPPLALVGGRMGASKPTYRPGEVWEIPEGGRLDVVDTSAALAAIVKYIEFLLRRLSTNSRIPESVLGRVKPSEVPSGVALALSFGPLKTMINEMRLVRDEKYPLLFRFAHRMSEAAGLEVPQAFQLPILLEFGSFLPDDQAAAVEQVTSLIQAQAISLESAIGLLITAGFAIDDAAAEVERIHSQDFEGANTLFDATGDNGAVRGYLGLEAEIAGATPPIPVPPILPPLVE